MPLARNIEFYAAIARQHGLPFPLRYDIGLRVTSRPWSTDVLLGIRINKIHTMYKMPLPRDTEAHTIENFIANLQGAALKGVTEVIARSTELGDIDNREELFKKFIAHTKAMSDDEVTEAIREARESVRNSIFALDGGLA